MTLDSLNDIPGISPSQKNNRAHIYRRDDDSDLVSQVNADTSLRVISQPKNVSIINLTNDYRYNSTTGEGITVYIINTDINTYLSEYQGMPGRKHWMFPTDPNIPDNWPSTESNQTGHGTCMLSKIAGPRYGVAKKVDVVIVKLPSTKLSEMVQLQQMMKLFAWRDPPQTQRRYFFANFTPYIIIIKSQLSESKKELMEASHQRNVHPDSRNLLKWSCEQCGITFPTSYAIIDI